MSCPQPVPSLAAIPLVILLVASAQESQSALPDAWKHWRYSAPLLTSTIQQPRLLQVLVPESVSGTAAPQWADLRLIDDAGAEVPFVLTARLGQLSRESRAARLVDVTREAGAGIQAIVDLGAGNLVHNQIELETTAQDFFARVTIDVSPDASHWRTLEEGAPIYRFARQGLEGNQTVRYPASLSRYLRLRITSESDTLPLTGVRVWHEVKEEAELAPVEMTLRPAPSSPANESWWIADTGAGGDPLSQVEFTVDQPAFHRPVRVRASDDGETWRSVGSGEIYRLQGGGDDGSHEALRVRFAESRARFWRVEIVNRDDAPLAGITLTLYATPRRVVFRAEAGRSYRLIYGNPRSAAPQYELARVTPAAELESAAPVELGQESENLTYTDPAPWTERNPGVLWGALIVALAVLGLLAIRALKSSA